MRKKLEEAGSEKMRMREYFRDARISIAEAERRCGYARGFLSTGGVVGSDKLAMMMEAFPDADLYYIVTGKARPEVPAETNEALARLFTELERTEQNRRALMKKLAEVIAKI